MSETDKIVERIKKLLRLGRGTNHTAEAMAAIKKAQELADNSGISIDGLDIDKEQIRITHESGGVKRCTFARTCSHHILSRHFSVRIFSSSFQGCVYIGPSVNIAIAKHVESFLIRECTTAWAEFEKTLPKRKVTPNKKKTFEVNFFAGIDTVLSQRPIRNDKSEIATAIELYTNSNFKLRTTKVDVPTRMDHTIARHGYLQGVSTNVSRPVESAVINKAITQ